MDRYVRVRKIGEGSFGKALLVKANDGKHYVIKEINISKMKPREREESRKEVKVLSQLKHPNIVTYMESFEETGNLYIVMDYCDGGDLYKKINGQRGVLFHEEQVMDWFVQIALGIKHVHDRKILHRDIKSQNIFLTRHGIVKLGDFGIARVLHSTLELARTCIGTPYYLSPEIVENRPYNNKSDIWSLGCVLYEMLTLKHAFEAGNMKNLILKIIKGSYPPIPMKYSADIRLLVSQLLKRNPRDRPSVNTILKKNFIQKRIQKFLSEEVLQDEFSHTVLHQKPFGVQGQRPLPPKPAPVKPAAVPKISKPEAKYSVSVAKKKPAKKRGSGGEAAKRVVKDRDPAVKLADKRKEMDARERRRKELIQNQDQMYNEHMKKIQQQRWERQQREQINRAREQAWKSTLSVGLSPEKQAINAPKQQVVNKDPQPMNKYQRPLSAQERKENIPEAPRPLRPVSAISANNASPNPTPAREAALQGQINREYAAKAAEQARIKEEYWARKREAARNKNRGLADFGGYDYKPPVLPKAAGGGGNGNGKRNDGMRGRNREEQDYLARLEAIRHQNYAERRELQKRMAGIRGPPQAKPPQKEEVKVPGDPRYDPEARRKKIAALKQQAEERAAMLRRQLDEKKKAVLERLNKAGKEKWEQEQKNIKERPSADESHIQLMKRAVPDEKPVAAAVGLETALKQAGVKTLFRSNSENDIAKLNNEVGASEEPEVKHHPRKKWGDIPFQPRLLPLEVTSSHMEATSAQDAVIKSGEENSPARRQWGQQQTQIVNALGNIKLQTATTTMSAGTDQSDAAVKNKNTFVAQPGSPSAGIGQTITIQKQQVVAAGSSIGQTITVSSPSMTGLPVAGSPATPNTVILKKKPAHEETIPEEPEEKEGPASVKKAWDEKPSTLKDSSAPKSPCSPKTDTRQAYDQFIKSVINEEKKSEQPSTKDKDSAVIEDLEEEDASIEESSFHTADGSPGKSYAVMLKTGNFDTNSKRLRTCSMPDLRLLFTTPVKNPFYSEQDDDVDDNDNKQEQDDDDENDVDEDEREEEEELEEKRNDDDNDNKQEQDDDHDNDVDEDEREEEKEEEEVEEKRNDDDDSDVDEDEGEEVEEKRNDDDNNVDDNDNKQQQDDDDENDGDDGEEFGDYDEEEEELAGASDDDEEEEAKEYENMLASMRDVLVSSARSPSPLKAAASTVQSMDWDPTADTAVPPVDDADGGKDDQSGRSSELSNLNEDWDSGEGEDDGDEDVEDGQKEQEDDSVFQRLEESRLALEQELGFDRFLRVYKYLQAVQENEDENANVGSSEEITELLGDKEHLYPKILYLVIADSAYNEDNQ